MEHTGDFSEWPGDGIHLFVDASLENGVAGLGVICAQGQDIPNRRWALSCAAASGTEAELLAIEFGLKEDNAAGLQKIIVLEKN